MPKSPTRLVHISLPPQQPSLTPAQKKFNNLIQQIDAQKQQLAAWQDADTQCKQLIASKLNPLRNTFGEHQAAMLALLDELYTTQKFTKNQQDKMVDLILELSELLIMEYDRDDLKPIYNRYSAMDFDAEIEADRAAAEAQLKSLFEQEYGVALDDDEVNFSDLEATQRLMEKLRQQQADAAPPPRKKTARQLAKEAREKEEDAHVSKSIQAVYRQLIAALHPDREPNAAERERKTELMKQVTVAYKNKDLLKLFELQLKLEQIDTHSISHIAEAHLKHYNKILQTQLAELRNEAMQQESLFRQMARLAPFELITPKRLMSRLNEDINLLRQDLEQIQHDLRAFSDVKQFKAWLKHY